MNMEIIYHVARILGGVSFVFCSAYTNQNDPISSEQYLFLVIMGKRRDSTLSSALEKLFRMIQKGSVEELNSLIEEQSDVASMKDLVQLHGKRNGDYLVTVAARHGRTTVLRLLRDRYDASLEVANFDGKRPIHEAAHFGHTDCVSYLISGGVDVDALKRATWTPLMLACTKGDLNVIKLLIEEGGATYANLKNKDGWTCFHLACRVGSRAVLEYLLRLNPDLWQTESAVRRTPLHTASLHGKIDAVRVLLQVWRKSIDCRDACGATPFTDALKGGHVEIAELLLAERRSDIDPNSDFDSLGRRPIDLTAIVGDVSCFLFVFREMTKTISAREALLRPNGDRARTPLHYAALEGHHEIVGLILDRLKDIEVDENDILIVDAEGRTPLDLASLARRSECVESLSLLAR